MSVNDQFHGRGAVALGEIHPTAIVHPQARLGRGVIIGPYSVIGPDVTIGDDTEIGSNVVLENRVTIGVRNRIFHGAVIGTAPQDLKYEGADTAVVIGNDNTIREFVTINIATETPEVTQVGSGCLLMAYSHVAHNCLLGDSVIMANSVNLAGHVQVDDYAIIGGMTAVHQFVSIGAHSFIGGLSRISKDVPPFVKVAGIPPIPAGINSIGLERRGFTPELVAHAKEAYRLLYRRGLPREDRGGWRGRGRGDLSGILRPGDSRHRALTAMAEAPLVVLSCGEASGDLYCSKIARALRMQRPDLRLAGIAGPRSREAGVEPWAEQESLAVMGFVEIVRHFPRIRRVGLDLVARAREERAALFLPVDYPGFHMRVARKMRRAQIPVLDFIPPKTWSWGRHRLKGLPESVDRAAVIFPFEEDHYRSAGVDAHFVGHPLVDVHAGSLADGAPAREGLLLAPGSRRQELLRIVPVVVDALRRLRARGVLPEVVTVSQAPGVDPSLLEPLVAEGAVLSEGELFSELRSARAAIVCSGTATVEAALAACPHAIVYRTGALTYAIARRVASVEHIGMANIVLGRRAFPELLQGDLDGESLAGTIEPLLDADSPASAAQAEACGELRTALGEPGCFTRVAEMALEQIDAGGA